MMQDFKGAVHRMSLLRKEPPMDDLVKAQGLYMQAVMGDVYQGERFGQTPSAQSRIRCCAVVRAKF
jgi:acyl-CoA-binding protein